MRSSRPCLPPVRCPRLALRLGLLLLVGLTACGSPSPDAAVSGHTTGSAGAVVSLPAGDAASAGPAANEPARDDRMQPTRLGPTTRPAAPPGTLSTEAARVTTSAPNARTQPTASPAATAPADPPDEQTPAEQAQRQARDNWYAEAREHPDVSVRLQALEFWAQQPTETIDPVTAALVDEDEQVRTRAQDLYDQQLTREASRARPVQEEGQKGGPTQ